MSITSQQIVAEARSWCGTPYVHQASEKGVGADCLGVVLGVWRRFFGETPSVPEYSPAWGEINPSHSLVAALDQYLCPTDQALSEGQVLVFKMHELAAAKHIGILTQTGQVATFVHAYSGRGVVETHLSTPWRRRNIKTYTFPRS